MQEQPSVYWRQLDIYNPDVDKQLPLTIIGAGGIGSFTTLALVKLGIKQIKVVDFDIVDEHNMPNQLYGELHIHRSKVSALAEICMQLSDKKQFTYFQLKAAEYFNNNIVNGIVISAVDSMKTRKEVWEDVKNSLCEIFFDARIGGSVIKLYHVDMLNDFQKQQYEESLHTDEEGVEISCTAAGIIDVGFSAASLVAKSVRKVLKDVVIPFLVVYDHENFNFYKFKDNKNLIQEEQEND